MPFQYSQSTGCLTLLGPDGEPSAVLGTGYAGRGPGLNNPAMHTAPTFAGAARAPEFRLPLDCIVSRIFNEPMPFKRIAFVLPLVLLAACNTSVTTPPTPAPVTFANSIAVLASATDAAAHAIAAAQANGTMSAADVQAAGNVIVPLSQLGQQIDAEQRSADIWAVQKTTIAALIANAGLAQAKAHLSPAASALLTAAFTALNQISSSVGGPVL